MVQYTKELDIEHKLYIMYMIIPYFLPKISIMAILGKFININLKKVKIINNVIKIVISRLSIHN
jgi:hypothetical protein